LPPESKYSEMEFLTSFKSFHSFLDKIKSNVS
jgi:hypothetical protein